MAGCQRPWRMERGAGHASTAYICDCLRTGGEMGGCDGVMRKYHGVKDAPSIANA